MSVNSNYAIWKAHFPNSDIRTYLEDMAALWKEFRTIADETDLPITSKREWFECWLPFRLQYPM